MTTVVGTVRYSAPGPRQLSQLTRSVLEWVLSSDGDPELEAKAVDSINSGIGMINSENWKKLRRSQVLLVRAGQDSYEVNYDVKEPSSLTRIDAVGQKHGRFNYKDWRTFNLYHDYHWKTKWIHDYTFDYDANQVKLSLLPTTDHVAQWPYMLFEYHRRIQLLNHGADVLDAPHAFGEMLVWFARMELSGIKVPAKMQLAERQWQMRWNQLLVDDNEIKTDMDFHQWVI